MNLPSPNVIALVFGISETTISLVLRARGGMQRKDRGSLAAIWIVVGISIAAGIWATYGVPEARMPWRETIYPYGFALFVCGIVLRWWSIWTLGRFFTVQVAIAGDHQLIQHGPYRWLRHPSYTGSLMMFVGFALCLGNWVTMAVMLLPVLAVFAWRIHVEEAALAEAFGDAWREHARRTWRLLPFVY